MRPPPSRPEVWRKCSLREGHPTSGRSPGYSGQGQETQCSRSGPLLPRTLSPVPASPAQAEAAGEAECLLLRWLLVAPEILPPLLWALSLGRAHADDCGRLPLPATECDGITTGFSLSLLSSHPGPSSPRSALSPGTVATFPGLHWFLMGSAGQQAA